VLTLITGVALLLTVAGNIVLGVAIWRFGSLPTGPLIESAPYREASEDDSLRCG
jgi:hypothetical protein